MRKYTASTLVFTLLLATSPTQADPGDYLEIYPSELKILGLTEPYTIEEGQPINIECTWNAEAVDSSRQWYAGGKEHRFPVYILVDGVTIGDFEGILGPRTRIGKADGSRGFSVTRVVGPAAWGASGPGDHKVECVANEPRNISDRLSNNNRTDPVTIHVTSKKPAADDGLVKALQAATQRPATTAQSTVPATQRTLTPSVSKQSPAVAVASVFVVEAEALIPTAAVSAGLMVRQDMAEFGAGWGGNAQLFWRPPTPAGSSSQLLTEFVLPSAGTYDLVLFYTKAPDAGLFTVFIDGLKSSELNGYESQVALGQLSLGRHQLTAGQHELAFAVTGKNQQSTGYIIGVDRLQLTVVP